LPHCAKNVKFSGRNSTPSTTPMCNRDRRHRALFIRSSEAQCLISTMPAGRAWLRVAAGPVTLRIEPYYFPRAHCACSRPLEPSSNSATASAPSGTSFRSFGRLTAPQIL
jgi:hypothetical protein